MSVLQNGVTLPEEGTVNAASSFAALKLRPEILRAIEMSGYTIPTPVQAEAIPLILSGRDALAGAQTGTGKTAGFTLPILQLLMESGYSANGNAKPTKPGRSRSGRPVRSLILTPTRELCAQVEESVKTYGRFLPLTSHAIFGGVSMGPQFRALRQGVDILVATPGRLLDHLNQGTADLSQVEILVLDEADRMLDMGFIRDIRRILPLLPPRCQHLLFSATFSNEIKALANDFLNDPVEVQIARPNQESPLVTQSMYGISRENKRDLLTYLLTEKRASGQALVFTRTKHGADRLAKQLIQDGISAAPIHGNRTQGQRIKALADFKAGATRILVATDIAARGLDIPQLPYVYNYELPNAPEDYVHRIGRTGRAGSEGEAISLVSPDERKFLNAIERMIGKPVERREAHGFSVTAFRAANPASMEGTTNGAEGNNGEGNDSARRPEMLRPSYGDDRTGRRPRSGGSFEHRNNYSFAGGNSRRPQRPGNGGGNGGGNVRRDGSNRFANRSV
jgi:ATP-dependent RNA helicase RhlE